MVTGPSNFGNPDFSFKFAKLGIHLLAERGASMLPKSRTRPVVQAWLAPHIDAYERTAAEDVKTAPFLRQAGSAVATGTVSFFAQSVAAVIDSVGQALTQETPSQAFTRIAEDMEFGNFHFTAGAMQLFAHPPASDHATMVAETKLGLSALSLLYAGKSVGNNFTNFKMPTVSPMPVMASGAAVMRWDIAMTRPPSLLYGAGILMMDGGTQTAGLLHGELQRLYAETSGLPTELTIPHYMMGPWKPRLEALHDLLARFLGMPPHETIVVEMGPGAQRRLWQTLAPRSRRVILIEPEVEVAGAISSAMDWPGFPDNVIFYGHEIDGTSIKPITGGGADIVYVSHPAPPRSPSWVAMEGKSRVPAHVMNELGIGVRDGGFLVIQTEVGAYAAAFSDMAALGWEPVSMLPLNEPFMPSFQFHSQSHLLVFRRPTSQ